MLRIILTGAIFLLGLFDLFMAVSFLSDPVQAGVGFGLSANGAQGLSSLRGDFTAFFGVIAISMMWGAWRRNGDLLLVPAALMGTVLVVRAISLALDGTYPNFALPMTVEFLHVVTLLAAWKVLPHHRIAEIAA